MKSGTYLISTKTCRFLGLILCGLTTVLCCEASQWGDANGDGKMDREDAYAILGKATSAFVLGASEQLAADVNGDGVVNALDAILVLQSVNSTSGQESDGFGAVARLQGSKVTMDLNFTQTWAQFTDYVEVRLLDLAGNLLQRLPLQLHTVSGGRQATAVFALPESKSTADLAQYIVEISGYAGEALLKKKVSLYRILPRMDVNVFGPESLVPGYYGHVRIVSENAISREPLAGAQTRIELLVDGQNEPLLLCQGSTDEQGVVEATFAVPSGLSGEGDLVTTVVSDLGERILKQNVRLVQHATILLTTDKPLYQPGQTIHIRALSLKKPQMTPAAGELMVITVSDAKGNKVCKKISTLNDFGVAHADFTLATELNLGAYKVTAAIGECQAEKEVTVKRYSLPKFKLELDTDHDYYAPSDTLHGRVTADYFFGKPVADGQVAVSASKFDVEFTQFAQVSGTTDDQGNFDFSFNLPDYFIGQPLQQGEAFVLLEIGVIDGAAHEEKITRNIPVSASEIVIQALPECGKLLPGMVNKVYLLTLYPNNHPAKTTCSASIGTDPLGSVVTDDAGIAILELTPEGTSDVHLTVQARDPSGHSATKSFVLALNRAAESLLVRTDRTLYKVGDELKIDVFASHQGGSIFVDILKEGQLLDSRFLKPENARSSLVIPLSADSSGTLCLSAYQITPGSDTLRDRRIIYVDPANDLHLTYEPDKETYLPGEAATIRLQVNDAAAQPVVAAIGLNIVDESVFALQDLQPGMEKVYFYLEEQLRQPRYEIHGYDPEEIISQPSLEDPGQDRDRALGLLFAALPEAEAGIFEISSQHEDQSALKETLLHGIWQDLADLIEPLSSKLIQYESDRGVSFFDQLVRDAIGNKLISPDHASDPWGTDYRIRFDFAASQYAFECAGPDQRWATSDDLAIVVSQWLLSNSWYRENPVWQWGAQPLPSDLFRGGLIVSMTVNEWDWLKEWDNATAGGGIPVPSAGPGSGEAKPYLRQYFPETLYSNPLLITETDGSAEINLNMADSITSWRLTGLASSADGRLGSATANLRVFQEFFVDLDLPPTLTQGDEVSVPVAVYNYLPAAQNIRLVFEPTPGFTLKDATEKTVTLQPNQVSVVYFRVQMEQVGRHPLQVTAYGTSKSDAIAREVEVVPNGQEVLVTHSGRLGDRLDQIITIPEAAIDQASKVWVKIYPGFFSQVVEGLDSMLRMPFGCFEQTSSVTYPNVLAVQYMKTTGQITPEILMKAEGFISAGYQRLLSYEVAGGGFEWFGNPPAHNVLTTYGLMEFSDMSRVWFVDPDVIKRTQDWLVKNQETDGSWIPTEGGIAEGAIDRYQNDVLRTTAYVVWGLSHSSYSGPAIASGIAYVNAKLSDPELKPETYTLALCTHALLVNPNDPRLPGLFQEFEARKKVEGEKVWWEGEAPTLTYSRGKGADVELTALLAQAYLRYGQYPETTTKALNYLAAAKDGQGNFGSTQATVQTLKAFCLAAEGSTQTSVEATVRIAVNGVEVKTLRLTEENYDVMFLCDLQAQTVEGQNKVSLDFTGTGACLYQIVGRYYLPWAQVPTPAAELISIEVAYDKTELSTEDLVTCQIKIANNQPGKAKMVVIDVGLPPGFEVLADTLESLVGSTVQKYQIAGRQVIFYLEELAHDSPLEFAFQLKAQYPIRAQTPESVVYEYYNPEVRGVSKPLTLSVSK